MHMPLTEQSPEQLIDYIGQLRSENKDIRTALEGFSPQEQQGLVRMISQFSEDRVAGATSFRNLADMILNPGEDVNQQMQQQVAGIPQVPQQQPQQGVAPAQDAGMVAQLTALLQQQTEMLTSLNDKVTAMEQQQVEAQQSQQAKQFYDKAVSLGYEPETPAMDMLFRTAANVTNGDLTMAARIIGPSLGMPEINADGSVSTSTAASAAAGTNGQQQAPKQPTRAPAAGTQAPAFPQLNEQSSASVGTGAAQGTDNSPTNIRDSAQKALELIQARSSGQ